MSYRLKNQMSPQFNVNSQQSFDLPYRPQTQTQSTRPQTNQIYSRNTSKMVIRHKSNKSQGEFNKNILENKRTRVLSYDGLHSQNLESDEH